MSTSNGDNQQKDRQIAIRLTTKDEQYSIPPTKFLVPHDWRRFHLSELINKVLNNSTPIPFDFLISSTLLRTSLGGYLNQSGLSEEDILEIEYLPSTLPPKLEQSIPAKDWVSDLSAKNGAILTSSYAGTLSLITSPSSSEEPKAFVGHDLSVLSCCHVQGPKGEKWIASGGMDRVGRVWEYESSTPKTLYTLNFHTAPISSIRSRPSSSSSSSPPHLLTASWDGLLALWDLTPGSHEDQPSSTSEPKSKRRKPSSASTTIPKTPLSILTGPNSHTSKISSALFDRLSPSSAYSIGTHDHRLISWDLATTSIVSSKHSPNSLLSLGQMSSRNLLVTGSMERTVDFWDTRDEERNVSLTLKGHKGAVAGVAPHPVNPLLVASAGYEGQVRVWDARSERESLFVLDMPQLGDGDVHNGGKLLTIDWDEDRIVAGGEAGVVAVWRVSDPAAAVVE